MIKIYVKSECDNPTLEYPEYKKIASEYIPEVWEHIKNNQDVRIVTCSSRVVDFVGLLIYEKQINSEDVDLTIEGKTYKYDDEGILLNWPFGYFSYFSYLPEIIKK